MFDFLESYKNGAIINIKVIPKSSKNAVGEIIDRKLKVYVTVAPEKGKANIEIIKLFSKKLKIAKSKIHILSGEISHIKTLFVEDNLNNVNEALKNIVTIKDN